MRIAISSEESQVYHTVRYYYFVFVVSFHIRQTTLVFSFPVAKK